MCSEFSFSTQRNAHLLQVQDSEPRGSGSENKYSEASAALRPLRSQVMSEELQRGQRGWSKSGCPEIGIVLGMGWERMA